jgi:hypothetical protein
MTENSTWNASTVNIYKNALNTMINAGTFTKFPVVVNTAVSNKVVVGFVSFKPLAYRYGTTYYPNTALVRASFPSTGSSCTYFCLAGAISNATSQTAGMLAPTGPTSYNLGVNTIVPLQ